MLLNQQNKTCYIKRIVKIRLLIMTFNSNMHVNILKGSFGSTIKLLSYDLEIMNLNRENNLLQSKIRILCTIDLFQNSTLTPNYTFMHMNIIFFLYTLHGIHDLFLQLPYVSCSFPLPFPLTQRSLLKLTLILDSLTLLTQPSHQTIINLFDLLHGVATINGQ